MLIIYNHFVSLYSDKFIDEVIDEIRKLWPEVVMVRGSPRRSTTNEGVERFNQTMEKKIGAWMSENNSPHWSIGCKICM